KMQHYHSTVGCVRLLGLRVLVSCSSLRPLSYSLPVQVVGTGTESRRSDPSRRRPLSTRDTYQILSSRRLTRAQLLVPRLWLRSYLDVCTLGLLSPDQQASLFPILTW